MVAPALTENGLPRRAQLEYLTPIESAVRELVLKVEAFGCHPLLTDAVVLLSQVQGKLADFIELEEE